MDADDLLLSISSRQHGFATSRDARSCGLSREAVRHRVRSGEWEAHGRRVLRRAGAPWTKASPLMLGVLDAGPGAVLSHTTAAAWWGLPGFDLRTIHVTRPRGVTSAPARVASTLHTVVDLGNDQVTVLDGIPIVRPERVIFELCATVHPMRAERALDAGWTRGLYSGDTLRRLLEELSERGRTGICVLRSHLEARPGLWVPPASNLESRVAQITSEALLGPYRRQVDLGGEGGWAGRVDFRHQRLPLVLEVQSERYHDALTDRVADARRRGLLEAAGFVVVELWDREVWHDRDVVIARVREAEWPLRRTPAA